MSGFVVGYGRPDRHDVEDMFSRIKHRGPKISGTFITGLATMCQNYLEADGVPAGTDISLPVADSSDAGLRICLDAQMGNLPELAEKHGIEDGPLRQERLLLSLYGKGEEEMLESLNDAIFAFVICDGNKLLAGRDLLGIKTLFYGWKDGTLYLASELKSLVQVTDDVNEFPPGHVMDEKGNFRRFIDYPENPDVREIEVDDAVNGIREIILKSLRNRVDFSLPTASLLSGGIDSSVIACLGSKEYREKTGGRLKTFALGVGESQDIINARLVALHIDTEHHELIVDVQEMLNVLSDVVYHLESFDPSLVRSSASNYLISRLAAQDNIQVLLSGEGGDEVFCGYTYLKDYPLEEQYARQVECMKFLHSNASLRLDRMNQCNGIKVVTPLISTELLNYAVSLPPEFKQKRLNGGSMEKWIFRKAFENDLPEAVVWRSKQEFSQGSGSADVLPNYFHDVFSDDELKEAQEQFPMIRSKEELYYFRLFAHHFGAGKAVHTVGQWVKL